MKVRTIRIRYKFTYDGETYDNNGVPIGDDMRDRIPVGELRVSAVYDALGDSFDSDFIDRHPAPTITQWRKTGFEWDYCEIDE